MKLFSGRHLGTTLKQEAFIDTPLGNISLKLFVEEITYVPNKRFALPNGGTLYGYYYDQFDAELVICKLKLNIPSHMVVDNSQAAVFRVKPNNTVHSCNFVAEWEKGYTWETFGSNSGQHLESVEYKNRLIRLHLGTQDGEELMYRKINGDLIPNSLELHSDLERFSFIEYINHGFRIPFNQILKDEICQVHFIVAWTKNIADDVSTWFAVDQLTKYILEGEELI
ncbi:hypothetical protein J2T12_001034 [Paenibacillus anaericanus]|uniref:hypothetical protein n=1 Tax=Paenibacillus anaericanus TaxID=170367 RepID=UPI002781725B|nr:hypothetical protein [Paenibacillus anaericanus]MDQ0087628.1 hypothetical protein [Paenibacillus anaericanus]